MQNVTKKQHYLPQFYLKRFSDVKGNIYYYDKKNSSISGPKFYSAVGYKDFFYASETGIQDDLSQYIEHWLKIFEDIISFNLKQIIERIHGQHQITHDDKYILASFMCMLWLRTPSMRQGLNRMHEDLLKQLMQFNTSQQVDNFIRKTSKKISQNERDNLINFIEKGEFDIRFSNIQHIKFMTETFGFNDKGFTNMFYGHKWKIYINQSKHKFITSENPVIEWWEPPKSFWDAKGFLERTKYFSLTPEIFVVLSKPEGSKKVNRKTLFDDDLDMIREFNLLIGSRKSDYVYSSEKSLLEELHNSRINPGQFEKRFYQKYDYPWDEYRKSQ